MENEITFDVLYYGSRNGKKEYSHKYSETWKITSFFCPNCGKMEVWAEQSTGDYYVGIEYICMSCEHRFNLPIETTKAEGEQNRQRVEAIKNIASSSEGPKI